MNRKTAPQMHPVFVVLLGGVCSTIGIIFLLGVYKMFHGWSRTRAGMTTEARLISVERKVTIGKNASVTTLAKYHYNVNGQEFFGDRVAIFKATEPFYGPLSSALNSGKPIQVFIDPQDPSFAVIVGEFSLGPLLPIVIFFIAFLGIGIVCLSSLLRGPRRHQIGIQLG